MNGSVTQILNEASKRLGIDLYKEVKQKIQDGNDDARLFLAKSLVENTIKRFNEKASDLEKFTDTEIQMYMTKPDSGPWPPWLLSYDDYLNAKSKNGKDLVEYIEYLARLTDQISKAENETYMAIEMTEYGFYGFGFENGEETMKSLREQNQQSTLLKAELNEIDKRFGRSGKSKLCKSILRSIRKTGKKNIYVTITIILASFIFWLLGSNTKQILGLVFNLTSDDLYNRNWDGESGDISDVYMNTGSMKSFMYYESLDGKKKCALPGVEDWQIEICKEEGVPEPVWGGGFFMEKKFGFYGAEGVFLLHNNSKDLCVAIMGACPYSKNNRTWIKSAEYKEEKNKEYLEEQFAQMYKKDKLEHQEEDGDYELFTKLGSKSSRSDEHGGETAILASIQKQGLYK